MGRLWAIECPNCGRVEPPLRAGRGSLTLEPGIPEALQIRCGHTGLLQVDHAPHQLLLR